MRILFRNLYGSNTIYQNHSESMKNKRLIARLNYVHITHFGFIFVLLTVAFYLLESHLTLKLILPCLLLAFLLTVILVMLTNFKLTHTINELIQSLENNKYLKSLTLENDNEIEIVRKYVGILENKIIFYEKENEKLSSTRFNLENDLKLARKLQRNLLPTVNPTFTGHQEFEIYAYSESTFEIGGDLYDYYLVDDEHLIIAVADVAGKGIAASLYMIFTLTLLRLISKPRLSVNDIIETLNNKLIEENISDMFVTIFMGILNTKTGEFNYCNAAHSFPCLITVNGDVLELSESHGIPIGIYPERKYNSSTISLNNGDQVFIYTDGLTDTIDENSLKYSVDVLKYNLMGTWFDDTKEVVEKIRKSVEDFRGKSRPVDDLTILNLKYTPGKSKND